MKCYVIINIIDICNIEEAITIFFTQINEHKGLPFEVRIPNKTTLKTFKKTDEGKELNKYKSPDEFFKKMRA